MTQLDISHVVGMASQFIQQPKKPHLQVGCWILRYIKSTIDYGIFYKKDVSCKITRYCDIDYIGDHDTCSITKYIFTLRLGAMSWCN